MISSHIQEITRLCDLAEMIDCILTTNSPVTIAIKNLNKTAMTVVQRKLNHTGSFRLKHLFGGNKRKNQKMSII